MTSKQQQSTSPCCNTRYPDTISSITIHRYIYSRSSICNYLYFNNDLTPPLPQWTRRPQGIIGFWSSSWSLYTPYGSFLPSSLFILWEVHSRTLHLTGCGWLFPFPHSLCSYIVYLRVATKYKSPCAFAKGLFMVHVTHHGSYSDSKNCPNVWHFLLLYNIASHQGQTEPKY